MIGFMTIFANNFEADLRDGFVSNDNLYTEHAIKDLDMRKKLRNYLNTWQFGDEIITDDQAVGRAVESMDFVAMLADFGRICIAEQPNDLRSYAEAYLRKYIKK